jgi:hypothetical protein
VFKGLANPGIKENMSYAKVYNLRRVKNDILAVVTVKSVLDPHMIIELKDDLNCYSLFIVVILYLLFI